MNSANFALTLHRKGFFRSGRSAVYVFLLAAALSTACTARCRQGLVLQEGLCRNPPEAPTDAGDDQLVASDGGPPGPRTKARTQATSAAEAGVAEDNVKDAPMPERMDRDAGKGTAMIGSSVSAAVCGNGIREGSELCDGADCVAECRSHNACIVSRLDGAAKTCNAQCTATEIAACASADGCCPNGCNHATDSDCSPSCGDGELTGTETCEPISSAYPCPTPASCDDSDPCTKDMLTGNTQQCSAQCAHMPIVAAQHGDGCCPTGANLGSDNDCPAACGDGVVSTGEECDTMAANSCPSAATCDAMSGGGCTRRRLSGSGCNSRCEQQQITERRNGDGCCPSGASLANDNDCAPSCGDGVVTWSNGTFEHCDPGVRAGVEGACPSTADCVDRGRDTCQTGEPKGSGCDVECEYRPVGAVNGDGCCTAAQTLLTDSDCSPKCGDGILTRSDADNWYESCDPAIRRGQQGACPTVADCSAMNTGCHRFELVVPSSSTALAPCHVGCVDANPNCSP